MLTLGAVPVSARIVRYLRVSAGVAAQLVAPEAVGSALYKVVYNLSVFLAHPWDFIHIVPENRAYLVVWFLEVAGVDTIPVLHMNI